MPGDSETLLRPAVAADLVVAGVNHRTAGASLRERLFVLDADRPRRLAELQAGGIGEALLLSTCDRVEVVAAAADPEAVADRLLGLLARWAGISVSELQGQEFSATGRTALRHLFAVAASLESQVIGEPQVLGQLKESHRASAAAGMTGPHLESALQAAYAAAKRVRRETPVAEQPVTIAASALRVARDLHGDLARCAALVVGLGEMSELLAGELKSAGLGDLVVTHRQEARAEAAAHRLRCHLRPWAELDKALASADIVISAVGTGRYNISAESVRAALKVRKYKPIFVIDAAIPGDVEPAVQELEEVFVYDLDDLERVARRGKENREGAAAAAWKVLGEELEAFARSRAERAAVPVVAALRQHAEALRREVLTDRRLDADAATRLLVSRLLHDPSETLRRMAAEDPEEREASERLLLRLFRIDPERKEGKR